eukprot:10764433-Alexandrium_andersonii.AAC.1
MEARAAKSKERTRGGLPGRGAGRPGGSGRAGAGPQGAETRTTSAPSMRMRTTARATTIERQQEQSPGEHAMPAARALSMAGGQ